MRAHSKMIVSTDAGGKTKRVTSSGISDTKNDIMLYSMIEAVSHEAATKLFETHRICKFRNHLSKLWKSGQWGELASRTMRW